MPAKNLMQDRRGIASLWASVNPTLASGEKGFETDTGKFKYGNGTSAWNSLPYAASQPGHTHSIADVTDYVAPVVSYSDNFMMMGA